MLLSDPQWGGPGSCGQALGSHGMRMPFGTTERLGEAQLGPIRDWICAGAPGG